MKVRIRHPNGTTYTIPVEEVVVLNDKDVPVALTYRHAGKLVHSDASHKDWNKVIEELRLK